MSTTWQQFCLALNGLTGKDIDWKKLILSDELKYIMDSHDPWVFQPFSKQLTVPLHNICLSLGLRNVTVKESTCDATVSIRIVWR